MPNNPMDRYLAPLRRRIRRLIARGLVRMVEDGEALQRLQVAVLGEARSVERLQNYGFTSVPLEGAEVVLAQAGGRGRDVAIVVEDRRYRMKSLGSGEVAIHDDQGQHVLLKRSGIEVHTSEDVTVDAGGKVSVYSGGDAKVEAGGNATVDATAIHLNGQEGAVVTTAHPCAYTGNPHPAGSATVKAGK